MKLATLAILATVAFPLAAYADSSQPNSAPGLEGQPVTPHGEGTTGINRGAYPTPDRGAATTGSGVYDSREGYRGTLAPSDNPGMVNPEPYRSRQ